jgi:hypothetical protein
VQDVYNTLTDRETLNKVVEQEFRGLKNIKGTEMN